MLISSLTGGRWARAAWPWLSIQVRLIPITAVTFVPYLCGMSRLYPWADKTYLTMFEHTENRQWLYQLPFVVGRSVVYWIVWTVIAMLVTGAFWKRSRAVDEGVIGGQCVAGISLVVLALSVTWAAIDWIMSFDPFFVSTLFGLLIGVGVMLSGISAAVAAVCFWRTLLPWTDEQKALGDLSNLLLAILMLWAYLSFSQFLIMWSGDLPIEAAYYQARKIGIWKWVTPIVSVIGFVVPFLCLLSHDFKRSPGKIGSLAVTLIAFRQIELWWMIYPGLSNDVSRGLVLTTLPTWLAVVGLYAIGVRWLMNGNAFRAEEISYVE